MALGAIAVEILRRVEDVTSTPVVVVSDPSLKVPARVKMARGEVRTHWVTTDPGNPLADFYVAFEGSFILRLYATPPEGRFLFGDSGKGRYEIGKLARALPTLKSLPAEVRDEFVEKLHAGLMTQLRSQPIGLRIHKSLDDEFPEFREAQADAIAVEQRDALRALQASIRTMIPEKVFSASIAMSAALAAFSDRLFGRSLFAVAYESAGLAEPGQELLRIADAIPGDPANDRLLVDSWAEKLEVSSWLAWVSMEGR